MKLPVKPKSLYTLKHRLPVMIKPKGRLQIKKVFTNSRTGQMTILIPKKKLKMIIPKRFEVLYW